MTSARSLPRTAWRSASDGYPRLLAVFALVNADLCIAGRERQLEYSVPLLTAELDRQILPDGGHIGRNPVTLVELITFRRKGHAEHDNQSYVPKEEIEAWEARDPIDRYVRLLTERGLASAADLAAMDARIQSEIDAAVATCEDEPLPDASTALGGVLAQPASAELEWYRRL